jgi:DNA modification methylase
MTPPRNTILTGDVRRLLPTLADESVDCIVTSPPYWGLRDYGVTGQLGLEATLDEYVADLVAVFREVRRALAPHGTLWLNLGDSYAGARSYQVPQSKHPALDFGAANVAKVPPGLKPKDLMGIPWRVALALQADGWYLRADIVWAKPNPMPESVRDRPTKAHEYVFLLAKRPRYYFDQEAVREPWTSSRDDMRSKGVRTGLAYLAQSRGQSNDVFTDLRPDPPRGPDGRRVTEVKGRDGSLQHRDGERWPHRGRNIRSVWWVATQPFPDAHFATFPEELARRCLLAGCPEHVCEECGEPRNRIVDGDYVNPGSRRTNGPRSLARRHESPGFVRRLERRTHPTGWTDCGHRAYRPGIVLDPFFGAGTTGLVAEMLGRDWLGVELNPSYVTLARQRLAGARAARTLGAPRGPARRSVEVRPSRSSRTPPGRARAHGPSRGGAGR